MRARMPGSKNHAQECLTKNHDEVDTEQYGTTRHHTTRPQPAGKTCTRHPRDSIASGETAPHADLAGARPRSRVHPSPVARRVTRTCKVTAGITRASSPRDIYCRGGFSTFANQSFAKCEVAACFVLVVFCCADVGASRNRCRALVRFAHRNPHAVSAHPRDDPWRDEHHTCQRCLPCDTLYTDI